MAILIVAIVVVVVALLILAASVRVIKQYERVVLFELGKVKDTARGPGLLFIIP
jgi:regulator of protease activity HflC (stomatin/prohibitin superfamily)